VCVRVRVRVCVRAHLHPLRTSDSPFLLGSEGGFEFFTPLLSAAFPGACVCVCVCVCVWIPKGRGGKRKWEESLKCTLEICSRAKAASQ
jgi:hypothetical protein